MSRPHPSGPVRRLLVTLLPLLPLLLVPLGSAAAQQGATETVVNRSDDPLLRPFEWRTIGPVGQGGRVDDIAVVDDDPHTFYVGFATGGLWKTTNNGVTFEPVFDRYGVGSIGAVAVAPSNSDVVWVGTGEANNRQSSSVGDGVYRSTDGGASFAHVGLRETQTIARIVVHPQDPDVAWVAAVGHLFGPNPERGVFKTSDGGESWRKVLHVDEDSGATDLVMDPSDPDVLFAATYQRRRTPCCFVGGGPGSGLWRSDDGGESWSEIRGDGLPRGTKGRMALAMTPADPDVIYVQIEVAPDREDPLTEADIEELRRLAREDELPPDPESDGVWRSDDKGESWHFMSNENGRPMYFSQIRVDPSNPDVVYTVDQRVQKSVDGGRSWETLSGYGHVDQHAFWINPADSDHLMIGNDGSIDVSYDQGETWESLRTWAVGQPYHASVDMRRPYYVCTGLQDNGSWCGPSSVRTGGILPEDWYGVGGGDGFYTAVDPTDYEIVYSESQNGNIRRTDLGTGETESIRPRAPSERFPESNIVPTPEVGTEIRWNWNTPFILSPHNPDVVHAGGNRLFTSLDRGETWRMSPDLTKDVARDDVVIMGYENDLPRCSRIERGGECILSRNDGVSRYSTITTIAESPIVPGLLWVGTDDGNVQVSRDGGATWSEVGKNVPGGTREYYISRVEASHHDPAVAYISVDGMLSDDLRPYIYVTEDYGESWREITDGLPEYGPVNTVRQDPVNGRLLYAGTEFGFHVSMDGGRSWQPFMNGLAHTRIDDVLVHPRDNDLVLATHGRSVLVMDDITPLQQMTPEVMAEDVFFFTPREAVLWKTDRRLDRAVTGTKTWQGRPAPTGTFLSFHLADEADEVELTVTDLETGEVFRTMEATGEAGLNRIRWDLRGDPPEDQASGFGFRRPGPQAEPGVYGLLLRVDGEEHRRTVRVLEDVWMDQR